MVLKGVLRAKYHQKHHINKYHEPLNEAKTFFVNSQGHLQCHQDPQLIYKPDDKGKSPDSREAAIYHRPGTK